MQEGMAKSCVKAAKTKLGHKIIEYQREFSFKALFYDRAKVVGFLK